VRIAEAAEADPRPQGQIEGLEKPCKKDAHNLAQDKLNQTEVAGGIVQWVQAKQVIRLDEGRPMRNARGKYVMQDR
jgi:hypothetical protein